jgi:hypothetical protein
MNNYSLPGNALAKGNDNGNILNCLHPTLINLPIQIRTLVCQECNWSIPTFYRKVRSGRNGKVLISNAEKEKILAIIYDVLTSQAEQIKSFQKK